MSAPAAEDPPDEMLVERQVDNASMDEAIRRYTAEHMTEASAKIEQHQTATSRTCPALIRIPGATVSVNAFKLVAVTGAHLLSVAEDSSPQQGGRPAKRARRSAAKAKAPAKQGGKAAAAVSDAEAAAADALVAILEGAAPAQLSAQRVLDLVVAAQRHKAYAVLVALPAYVKPLFSAEAGLSLFRVARTLYELTGALAASAENGTREALLEVYRAAWPRFSAPLAKDILSHEDPQVLLTYYSDVFVPPATHFDFLSSAAQEACLPPGLRLFFIIGATLASAAQADEQKEEVKEEQVDGEGGSPEQEKGEDSASDVDEGDEEDDEDDNSGGADDPLHAAHLQGCHAHETLTMPVRLRAALLQLLCRAYGACASAAARGAVQGLNEALMLSCAALVSPAPPVLLPAQRGVAYMLAEHDATRRMVVAARLPLDADYMTTLVRGLGLSVQAQQADSGATVTQVGVYVHVQGATDEQPRSVTADFGLAADSDAAARALVVSAQRWCRGEKPNAQRVLSRASLYTTLMSTVLPVGTHGRGTGRAFSAQDCKALGYKATSSEDAIVFACCQWPAPDAPAAAPIAAAADGA